MSSPPLLSSASKRGRKALRRLATEKRRQKQKKEENNDLNQGVESDQLVARSSPGIVVEPGRELEFVLGYLAKIPIAALGLLGSAVS